MVSFHSVADRPAVENSNRAIAMEGGYFEHRVSVLLSCISSGGVVGHTVNNTPPITLDCPTIGRRVQQHAVRGGTAPRFTEFTADLDQQWRVGPGTEGIVDQ